MRNGKASSNRPKMTSNYFKYLAYTLVVAGVFSAHAGSYDDFFVAIRNDNPSALTDLLRRGFDPNTPDAKGQPGLTIAIREHSLKAAKALLSSPTADVNALNQAGESPLMIAALKGDLAAAQLLLESKAKVNQSGWAPLHYAATGPEPKLVELLIERGADLDAESPNGTTPLMMAAQYGSDQSVEILLKRGADSKRRNRLGLGVVDFAKLSGREAVIKRVEKASR
jgi:ankyrin repeat protein